MTSLRMVRVSCVLLAVSVLVAIPADANGPRKIGDAQEVALETPHPAPRGARGEAVWENVVTRPGASYIAIHFSRFDLAPGEAVSISSPDGRFAHTFTGKGKPGTGGTFWATHVPGETAIVRYLANGGEPGWGYSIDRFAHGYPDAFTDGESTEALCGPDDSQWARCYETSEAAMYDKSRAVVRLMIQGTNACTGWLVGCEGHILTNNHCISTQTAASNTDYEFMAEGATCATSCASWGACPGTIVASSGTLVKTDAPRDYTLILLPVNPTPTYGYFKLRPEGAVVDERIYIPGHPQAWGKKIAYQSTHSTDPSGFCEVYSLNEPACQTGGPPDVGYFCDTQGGNSGSPVVAYSDHRVVALHHCANCPNRGVPIQSVIDHLGPSLPACSVTQFAGTVDLTASAYACSGTIAIAVKDDSIQGAGTQAVTIWSTTESNPETVVLTESATSPGSFNGSIPASPTPPSSGDGILSVSHGDTITVRYIDADDGNGNTNVVREDTATVDCLPPVITNVASSNVTGNSARITWTTDEASDSTVRYGTSIPPSSSTFVAPLVTAHTVDLTGLPECSVHYYSVRSADSVANASTDDAGGAYHTFSTGKNVSPSYPSSGPPIPIPDNNPTGATSTIAVTDTKTVLEVKVRVNITHTYDGDLSLALIAPNGATVSLAERRGGSGDNFTNTVFDDAAATAISAGTAPFNGTFRPESPLSAATGLPANGNWQFRVIDKAGADVGTIDNWTLMLRFPAASCGPHATYRAHGLLTDACSAGGPGNNNGRWDAGETVDFSVTVENDGTDPLTGVTATLMPTTPGVTMVTATASYPDLAAGAAAVSSAPHFRANLSPALLCGGTVSFDVVVSSNQGSWTSTMGQGIGQALPGGGTILSENFSSGIPATWTIVDGGSGGGAAATWTESNPGGRTAAAPMANPLAIVDSDNAGTSATQDEQLITPVLNLSTATSVTLDFDQYFRWYSSGQNEKGDVDVRSSLTGGAWVNVLRNQGASSANPNHRTIDLTPQAAGASDVQIRFRYYDAQYEWYWQVDNVVVTYAAPGGCAMDTCLGGPPPPPPVPDGTFGTAVKGSKAVPDGSSIDLTWDVSSCTGSDYHVLYGPLSGVSTYTVTGASCDLGTTGSATWTAVPPGDLWWVIVSDDNVNLEGSWGRNSSGGQRGGSSSSGLCSMTTRNNGGTCP